AAESAVLRADRSIRAGDGPGGGAEHVVQRERADRGGASGGPGVLPAHADGPAGAGELGGAPRRACLRIAPAAGFRYPASPVAWPVDEQEWRTMKRKRPAAVLVTGILNILAGCLSLLCGFGIAGIGSIGSVAIGAAKELPLSS